MGDIVPVSMQGGEASTSMAMTLLGPALTMEQYEERIKDANELEAKLKHIQETVPTKVYNVSSSSAGAGSGDFHQYRIVRRAEQDRVRQMDADWKKKEQEAEYKLQMDALNKLAEERTAKKRLKRQKKKSQKKQKKGPADGSAAGVGAGGGTKADSGDSGSDDDGQPGLD